MSKILWKSLLLSPTVLGATLVVSSSAMAVPTPTTAEVTQPQAAQTKVAQLTAPPTDAPAATPAAPAANSPATTSVNTLDEVNRYSNEGKPNNSLAQVTSVSQLSDVQPTDWAFQALQSLVERYGVIAGYPDGTFRGNRAMTRYEFAAGLNAALDRVNELIAAGSADLVRKEDLATLQRLQEEFAAELATLRGRVDSLEAQTAELEANQFSTTTKLSGEAIFAVTDEFNQPVENNTVLQDRVRLDFQTSFTGNDILHTRLAAGNADLFNVGGSAQGTQTFNIGDTGGNNVIVDWLAYQVPLKLPVFDKTLVYIAAFGGIHSDYAPTVNPYFEDYDGGNGALSAFASESPIYRIGGGAGGGFSFGLGKSGILGRTSITGGYLAGGANEPGGGSGLFQGDYAALGQLNVNVSDRFSIAATYVHGYHTSGSPIYALGQQQDLVDVAQPLGGLAVTGTAQANLPSTIPGVPETPLSTNSYGVEAAFRLSDKISLSAFGSYTNVKLLSLGTGDIWTFGGGVAFPDFGKEGSVLGLFAGVEPTLTGLDVPGDPAFTNEYGVHVEGFYKYQLTDNISVTPGIIWVTSPGQSDANDDVIIGTLRTTFKF